MGQPAIVSRTGYTGEDGFELTVPAEAAVAVWEKLFAAGREQGVMAAGLGARDTLRLEAAMPLYGHELSEETNPIEAGLSWAVKLDKGEFIGRGPIQAAAESYARQRVGLELDGKRAAREGCTIESDGRPVGRVTSGSFAPTLQKSIAMAYVESASAAVGTRLQVDIRGDRVPRSEEHTSELQSPMYLVCRLLL